MPVRVAVGGALGRVGRRLILLAENDPEVQLIGVIQYPNHPMLGKQVKDVIEGVSSSLPIVGSLRDLPELPDVIVEFSQPKGTIAYCEDAASLGVPIASGTTGVFSATDEEVLKSTSSIIPVIHSRNFSLGVNVLLNICGEVAAALKDFDIEIVEAHHNRKVDAPSGTALALSDSICDKTFPRSVVCGRNGIGKRENGEIGMHSLRMGDVVGDHTVYYTSDSERIEITHKAQSRDVFASGALRAAKWLSTKKGHPGMYSMRDVLF
eukprot:GHVR01131668.1.p1 GENE.GHVR01131668.1~~GHVR01131668.1.p1  ORF type:complete len:265 (-),score=35.68 GHVR01131668.1:1159-1953(-)